MNDERDEVAVPWGMQIALEYNKVRPARRVDAAEATARAVVSLLAHPLAAPGGPWHEAVRYWSDGRIRKLVRRARGQRWQDVQALDGVTVTQAGPRGWAPAQVRAFVPAPVRPLPPALAKTQVEGTHLPSGDAVPPLPAQVTAEIVREAGLSAAEVTAEVLASPQLRDLVHDHIALGAASASEDAAVTVEVTPLHTMTTGKLCAQVAHAAQLAWASEHMPEAHRQAWQADGFRVRVVCPTVQQWAQVRRPVSIIDAGFTELDGPTETTRAWWAGCERV